MGVIAEMDGSPPPAKRRRPSSWLVIRRRRRCVLQQAFVKWHTCCYLGGELWQRNLNAWLWEQRYRELSDAGYGYQHSEGGCSMCGDGTCPYCCDDCHGI